MVRYVAIEFIIITNLEKYKENITMNRNYALLFVSVVMLLSSCASTPTKDIAVDVQADPKANFSGYKTYAWLGAAAIINDPHGQWEPPTFDADADSIDDSGSRTRYSCSKYARESK